MKKLHTLLTVVVAAISTQAAPFLTPSNPPPVIQLAWNYSLAPSVSNYFVYYGVGSLQYTNKSAVGKTNTAAVNVPTRGVQYFFAVTAQTTNGLESVFSNETSATPAIPPDAPVQQTPVNLAVQESSDLKMWADTDMFWSVDPATNKQQYFRLATVRVK